MSRCSCSVATRTLGCRDALGTGAPLYHLRLINLITRVGGGGQAWGFTDCSVEMDRFSADATVRVVVIVTHLILLENRRPGGPDEALVGQDPDGVVHAARREMAPISVHR